MLTSEKESVYETYGKYAQNLALKLDPVTTTGGQNRHLVELMV